MPRTLTLLVLPCALLFAACGANTPSNKTDFAQPSKLEGKAAPYTPPAGTLQQSRTVHITGKNGVILSSAAVDKSGNFLLTLPDASAVPQMSEGDFANMVKGFTFTGAGCTSTVVLSNAQNRVYDVSILQLVQGNSKKYIWSLTQSVSAAGSQTTLNYWFYSLSATQLVGQKSCTGASKLTFDVSVHLKPGWNQVLESIAGDIRSLRSVDPASTTWFDRNP